jgi:hypothetical protein
MVGVDLVLLIIIICVAVVGVGWFIYESRD